MLGQRPLVPTAALMYDADKTMLLPLQYRVSFVRDCTASLSVGGVSCECVCAAVAVC